MVAVAAIILQLCGVQRRVNPVMASRVPRDEWPVEIEDDWRFMAHHRGHTLTQRSADSL